MIFAESLFGIHDKQGLCRVWLGRGLQEHAQEVSEK